MIARVHPSLVDGPALVHVDAYRLGGIEELDDLDLDASLDEAVTVVEWGTGVAEALADSRLEVRIDRAEGGDRRRPTDGPDPRRVLVAPVGPRWLGERAGGETRPVLTIAHLSDPHFGNRPGVADRSRRVAAAVDRIRPDVVVVTGDVADHGRPEEYAEARAVLGSLPVPGAVGHGQPRRPRALRRGLLDGALVGAPRGEPLDAAYDVAGHRFLMVDSLVPAPRR